MVLAALIAFGMLLMAWLVAPVEERPRSITAPAIAAAPPASASLPEAA